MAFQDILLNEDGDLRIENGDLVIGDCEAQDAQLILESIFGDFKFEPLTGCNIHQYLNMPMSTKEESKLKRTIREQMSDNGFNIKTVEISKKSISMDYKKVS